jgi:hypothetical protein
MSAGAAATTLSLAERWRQAWPDALAAWSRYTRLHAPRLCETSREARAEGLDGSFAMIRFADQSVVVDLQQVRELRLDDYAPEVLAHEIGHHVYAPANGSDHLRLMARLRRALPTLERHAPMVANLYTDLHINDRLQRQRKRRMDAVYRRLYESRRKDKDKEQTGALWRLYLRIYEQLWTLERGSLGSGIQREDPIDGDAWLGARLVRVYAKDWLAGSGRFATLILPYLVDDDAAAKALARWHDTRSAGAGLDPQGGLEVEDDELDGAVHPSRDPRITGEDGTDEVDARGPAPETAASERARGQHREPFEYGEILRAGGLSLGDHDIAVRYYRERALPHRIPFPTRPAPHSAELQLEGLEPWDIGDSIDLLDPLQSVLQSPRLIPGLSTVKRVYGRAPDREQEPVPLDLDLYVDSSGSMPNPQRQTSWLTLAGAVIVLSALRAGARVQATLWSGPRQFLHTDGFVRSEDAILRVLTGFYGGATAFPVHRLRDTYAARTPHDRPVHILHISDDGITTMFQNDERGGDGWAIAAQALARARGGGTMVLNLPGKPDADLQRAQREQGWVVEPVASWPELLGFARRFARRHYQERAR